MVESRLKRIEERQIWWVEITENMKLHKIWSVEVT